MQHKKGIKSVGAVGGKASVNPNIDNIYKTQGFDLGNLKVYAVVNSVDASTGSIKVGLDVNVDPLNYLVEFRYDDLSQLEKDPALKKQVLATIQKRVEDAVKGAINENRLLKAFDAIDQEVAGKLGTTQAVEDYNEDIEVVDFE